MDKNKKTIIGVIIGIIAAIVIILLLLKGCTKKEYKITFDTNGGNTISAVEVAENGKIKKPEDPEKEGYKFVGWYYNDELFDFDTKVNKNIKLEARWEKIGKEVESVSMEKTTLDINVGDEAELKATVKPSDAEDQELTWTSSDTSVVTVDKNGKIKALKEGKATVTVTSKNGKKAECTVTVTSKEVAQQASGNTTTKRKTTTRRNTQAPTTQAPTPTTTQARYVVTLQKVVQAGTNAVMQYNIIGVTKNGSSIDYVGFVYNGSGYAKSDPRIDSGRVNEGVRNATVTLSDGSKVSATVNYTVKYQ